MKIDIINIKNLEGRKTGVSTKILKIDRGILSYILFFWATPELYPCTLKEIFKEIL